MSRSPSSSASPLPSNSPSPTPCPSPSLPRQETCVKRKRSVSNRLEASPATPRAPRPSPSTHRRCSSSAMQPPRVAIHPPLRQALSPFPSHSSAPVPYSHSQKGSLSPLPKALSSPGASNAAPTTQFPPRSTATTTTHHNHNSTHPHSSHSHFHSHPPCPGTSRSPFPSPTASSSNSSTPSPISQTGRPRSPEPSPLSFRFPQTPKRARRSSAGGLLNELSISSPINNNPSSTTTSKSSRSVAGFLGPSSDNEFLPTPVRRSQYLIDYPHDAVPLGSSRYQEDFESLKTLHESKEPTNNKVTRTSAVYLVCHRITGVRYAIKKVSKRSNAWKSLNCPYEFDYSLSAFREARALASVSHPHIARYHNSWIEADQLYIQLEYCQGGSLDSVLTSSRESVPTTRRTFPTSMILLLIRHISSALAYLVSHQPRLVHCSVVPSNILIVPPTASTNVDLVFKLCDFGRLQLEGGEVDGLLDENDRGLEAYLPTTLSSISPTIDIFSLGLVAFELACEGRIPTDRLKEANHQKELRSRPQPFCHLILQMIHSNPFDRPTAASLSLIDPHADVVGDPLVIN